MSTTILSNEQNANSETNIAGAYPSQWGWHGLPYPEFRLLKTLHKQVWNEYRILCAIHRLMKKAPHNRNEMSSMEQFQFIKKYSPIDNINKIPLYHTCWDGSEWYTQRYERNVNKQGADNCYYTITKEAAMIIDEYRKLRKPALYPQSVIKPHPDLLVFLRKEQIKNLAQERNVKKGETEEVADLKEENLLKNW